MDKLNNAISDLAGNLADAEAEAKALHDYIEAAKEQGLTEINRFDYFVSFRLMLHESTQALERFRLENPHLMPDDPEPGPGDLPTDYHIYNIVRKTDLSKVDEVRIPIVPGSKTHLNPQDKCEEVLKDWGKDKVTKARLGQFICQFYGDLVKMPLK